MVKEVQKKDILIGLPLAYVPNTFVFVACTGAVDSFLFEGDKGA